MVQEPSHSYIWFMAVLFKTHPTNDICLVVTVLRPELGSLSKIEQNCVGFRQVAAIVNAIVGMRPLGFLSRNSDVRVSYFRILS